MDLSIFANPDLTKAELSRIKERAADTNITLMEVCGTHTVSIARYGFRTLLPHNIKLLSGPGCPVCVSANEDIDTAIALAKREKTIVCTFGDMMRVPGSSSSLAQEKAGGADVRVVYSPLDALAVAKENPTYDVVFIGVGFETTAPVVAGAALQAQQAGLENLSVLAIHKTMPGALEALVNDPNLKIDGLILPGHVSVVTGIKPFEFLAEKYQIPGVITGFEPLDILTGIYDLVDMVIDKKPAIKNAYPRGVRDEGNKHAQALIEQVFEPCDVQWRGLGLIPQSGLCFRPEFAHLDARRRLDFEVEATREHKGCKCGEVLKGQMRPEACALFDKKCSPQNPIGPCMVSSEGSCSAAYRYRTIS
ncbi:MAG: hydrogenase formation protein HypD [Coriobacteriia bacterium]|nr:hydrogenase formation protein HypD [Coriobacteriia bacterium]